MTVTELTAAVASAARVRAWLDGRDVQLAVTAGPGGVVPGAGGRRRRRELAARDAGRVLERARTAETMPALGDALSAGWSRAPTSM